MDVLNTKRKEKSLGKCIQFSGYASSCAVVDLCSNSGTSEVQSQQDCQHALLTHLKNTQPRVMIFGMQPLYFTTTMVLPCLQRCTGSIHFARIDLRSSNTTLNRCNVTRVVHALCLNQLFCFFAQGCDEYFFACVALNSQFLNDGEQLILYIHLNML